MSLVNAVWGEALDQGRLAHAYLLIGSGLEDLLGEFLEHIICEEACGECAQCQKIKNNNHPDIRYVERDGKRIKIDQVRALQLDARYPPLEAPKKIYVLQDVENLSIEAANGLLKTLESPPEYLLFLLTARTLKVLPTILSRCQVVRLNPAEIEAQETLLREHGLNDEEIEYALSITRGAPHRIDRVVEAIAVGSLSEFRNEVIEDLDSASPTELIARLGEAETIIEQREAAIRLLTKLPLESAHDLLDEAQLMSKVEEIQGEFFLEEALRWYRDLLFVSQGFGNEQLFNRDYESLLREQANILLYPRIQNAIETLEQGRVIAQGNANMQLFYEALFFKLGGSG